MEPAKAINFVYLEIVLFLVNGTTDALTPGLACQEEQCACLPCSCCHAIRNNSNELNSSWGTKFFHTHPYHRQAWSSNIVVIVSGLPVEPVPAVHYWDVNNKG